MSVLSPDLHGGVVIDIGCARHGNDYSLERLATMFQPSLIYGFDPSVAILSTPVDEISCAVVLEQKAAWVFDGQIGFYEDGLNSWTSDRPEAPQVPCFDLARFIFELRGAQTIVKMDCEGAEYDLLTHLILKEVDEFLAFVYVEWHTKGIERAAERRRVLEKELRCPIEEWRW